MRKIKRRPQKTAFNSLNGKAAFYTLIFTYVYLIAEIIYKHATTEDICAWEFVLLFLMFALFGFFKKLSIRSDIPKNFDGTLLPLSLDKKDRKIRNRFYMVNTAVYSGIFALVIFLGLMFSSDTIGINIALELFTEKAVPNFAVCLLITAILVLPIYAFTYMINYLWYENRIGELREEEALTPAPDISKEIAEIKAKKESASFSEDSSPTPKRRGRPPKVKVEEVK